MCVEFCFVFRFAFDGWDGRGRMYTLGGGIKKISNVTVFDIRGRKLVLIWDLLSVSMYVRSFWEIWRLGKGLNVLLILFYNFFV